MPQRPPVSAALMPARLVSAGLALCPRCRGALPLDQDLAFCLNCGEALSPDPSAENSDPLEDLLVPSSDGSVDPAPAEVAAVPLPRERYDPSQWRVATSADPEPPRPLRDSPVALTGWALELWLRRLAVPAMLLLAGAVHLSAAGRFAQRVGVGMMVHESGHAVTAWLAGFWAVPLPWVTRIAEQRSLTGSLALSAALILAASIGRRRDLPWLAVGAAALLGLQLWLTWGLSEARAQALITWGGDGAGIALAALLMALFPLGSRALLVRGGLRWGLLAIGAAAFVDLALPWLEALRDPMAIPYGRIEGVGLSDPSRMTDTYGWLQRELIHSYLATAALALAGVALSWWWGLRDAVFQRQRGAPLGDD